MMADTLVCRVCGGLDKACIACGGLGPVQPATPDPDEWGQYVDGLPTWEPSPDTPPPPPPPPIEPEQSASHLHPAVELPTFDSVLRQTSGLTSRVGIMAVFRAALTLSVRVTAEQVEELFAIILALKIADANTRSKLDKIWKSVDTEVTSAARLERSKNERTLQQWIGDLNRDFRIVNNYGGKPRIIAAKRNSDETYLAPQSPRDFVDGTVHVQVLVGYDSQGAAIFGNPRQAWYKSPKAQRYETQVFTPGIMLHASSGEYNVWRGWPHNDDESIWNPSFMAGWPTLHDYLLGVVCSNKSVHYEYLLGWFAHWIQNPRSHDNVAIGLRGKPGVGKTTLLHLAMKLVGEDYGHIFTNPESLHKNFNALMLYRMFLGFDEAFAAHDKKGEAILKNLVTGRSFTVEKKFVDAFEALKYFRMIFTSNEAWFIPVGIDDRRFFILVCSDIKARNKAYFDSVYAAIDGPELTAFFRFLKRVPLDKFDLHKIPITAAHTQQKKSSLTGGIRVLADILDLGRMPKSLAQSQFPQRTFFSDLGHENLCTGRAVDTTEFYTMLQDVGYADRMTQIKATLVLNEIAAGHETRPALSMIGTSGASISVDQVKHEGQNRTVRWLPELRVARRIFELKFNGGRDWFWSGTPDDWHEV